jgi:hypothetical protein
MDIPAVELNVFNKKIMQVLVDFLFVSSGLLIFLFKILVFSSALVKKESVFCEVYLLAIRSFGT